VFPLRKFDAEQIFVLVRMQLRNHVGTQPEKCFKHSKGYLGFLKRGPRPPLGVTSSDSLGATSSDLHEVALSWYCITQVSRYIKYPPVKRKRVHGSWKLENHWAKRYIYDIKFEMLEVCKNEISLRKRSGGTTQLRILR